MKLRTLQLTLQSHLYGIEMMELQNFRLMVVALQSHLYGIEIGEEKEDEQEQTGTPIAPLWN